MNTKPKKRLCIEELKSYPGIENFIDEMAEETIASLEALSIFLRELSKNHQVKERLKNISLK